MISRRSSNVRFTGMFALMLMASACSTAPKLPPQVTQAVLPAHLLVHPLDPPKVQRTIDPKTAVSTMTGADATGSLTQLYDYAGAIKAQLDALIDAVTARDAAPPPKKRRGFHL